MKSIREEWNIYLKALYDGQTMSRTQYNETMKAFYAGCGTMLRGMSDITDMPGDEGVRLLDSLAHEFVSFVNGMEKKKN